MKHLILTLCVVAALGFAVVAQAQIVETAMRGNTVLAAPSLSTAWMYNPAVLASLAGYDPAVFDGERTWKHAASADFEASGDTDLFALNWGGTKVDNNFGLGAGYMDSEYSEIFGAGFGKHMKKDWAWGVSWRRFEVNTPSSGALVSSLSTGLPRDYKENMFDVGFLKEARVTDRVEADVKYGIVVRDITGEFETMLDLGLAAELANDWLVALEIADISDEVDTAIRVGATKLFGSKKEWEVGAGLDDGDLTFGAMYTSGSTDWAGGAWKFGGAWTDQDRGDDSIIVGAFGTWGL